LAAVDFLHRGKLIQLHSSGTLSLTFLVQSARELVTEWCGERVRAKVKSAQVILLRQTLG
jgi:hypothetical protein